MAGKNDEGGMIGRMCEYIGKRVSGRGGVMEKWRVHGMEGNGERREELDGGKVEFAGVKRRAGFAYLALCFT